MKFLASIFAASLIAVSTAPSAAEKTAGEVVDDSWLHSKVKTELLGHGSSNINIEVYQGVVQLAGFVDSEEERNNAEKRAAAVQGVKRVSNQLVVQPASRSAGRALDDGVIATKVKSSLAENETTSAFRINVEVRSGEVLISGFVTSEAEREAAAQVAASVSGVTKVINGIDIATPPS